MQLNQSELKSPANFPANVISFHVIMLCHVPRFSLDMVDIRQHN